jgi:hypothetical protein
MSDFETRVVESNFALLVSSNSSIQLNYSFLSQLDDIILNLEYAKKRFKTGQIKQCKNSKVFQKMYSNCSTRRTMEMCSLRDKISRLFFGPKKTFSIFDVGIRLLFKKLNCFLFNSSIHGSVV